MFARSMECVISPAQHRGRGIPVVTKHVTSSFFAICCSSNHKPMATVNLLNDIQDEMNAVPAVEALPTTKQYRRPSSRDSWYISQAYTRFIPHRKPCRFRPVLPSVHEEKQPFGYLWAVQTTLITGRTRSFHMITYAMELLNWRN